MAAVQVIFVYFRRHGAARPESVVVVAYAANVLTVVVVYLAFDPAAMANNNGFGGRLGWLVAYAIRLRCVFSHGMIPLIF
jgi:hypothetical protein